MLLGAVSFGEIRPTAETLVDATGRSFFAGRPRAFRYFDPGNGSRGRRYWVHPPVALLDAHDAVSAGGQVLIESASEVGLCFRR